jgi:hypothetical protein
LRLGRWLPQRLLGRASFSLLIRAVGIRPSASATVSSWLQHGTCPNRESDWAADAEPRQPSTPSPSLGPCRCRALYANSAGAARRARVRTSKHSRVLSDGDVVVPARPRGRMRTVSWRVGTESPFPCVWQSNRACVLGI